jgi:hypothetical protein
MGFQCSPRLLVVTPLHLLGVQLFLIHLVRLTIVSASLLFYQEAFHHYPPGLVLGHNQPATASFFQVVLVKASMAGGG